MPHAILVVERVGTETDTIQIFNEDALEQRLKLLKATDNVKTIVIFKPATQITRTTAWNHQELKPNSEN